MPKEEMAKSFLVAAPQFREGVARLGHPAWPLVRLAVLLYLTGPFDTVEELVDELCGPLDLDGVSYPDPARALREYMPAMRHIEFLMHPAKAHPPASRILAEDGSPLDEFEGALAAIQQEVLEKELSTINSLLCAPCNCTICCTGPAPGSSKAFFEIPLLEEETRFLGLPVIDHPEARSKTSETDPPLLRGGRPFYEMGPVIIRWSGGPSLILPQGARCPALDENGRCGIYGERPRTCRMPQIFPYVTEPAGRSSFIRRGAILSVWDCPYVRALRDVIATYSERNGLAAVFRENKV